MIAWEVNQDSRDLVFEGGSPVLIEGVEKLTQDIRWAIVEPQGTDEFNPTWGSKVPNFIGESYEGIGQIEGQIQAEVLDAIRRYHNQILNTLETFRFSGIVGQMESVVAYSVGEIIREVETIRVVLQDVSDPRSLEFEIELTTEGGRNVLINTATGVVQ